MKLVLSETDTVKKIKEHVEKVMNISQNKQSLSSLGQILEDDKTLEYYNIRKGSIIDNITI